MAQNIYDDPAFFAAYARLDRSVRGLAGAPEWPALQALLPPLTGNKVVDLGCGYGWFSRWAVAAGASHVLGVDISERMLATARAATAGEPLAARVTYVQADLEQPETDAFGPPASVDLVFSSLTLHYLPDLSPVLAAASRVLAPGGRLVVSVEHPIFTAPSDPRWVDVDGRQVWPLDDYARSGRRVTSWLGDGVVKYHRTIEALIGSLIDAGLRIAAVTDFAPTDDQIAADPDLARECDRPTFLLLAAERPA